MYFYSKLFPIIFFIVKTLANYFDSEIISNTVRFKLFAMFLT